MSEEEHVWEPKSTAYVMDIIGCVMSKSFLAYKLITHCPSNGSPVLSIGMPDVESERPAVFEMTDQAEIYLIRWL